MKTNFYSYRVRPYASLFSRIFGLGTTILAIMLIVNGSAAAYAFLPGVVITQFSHYRAEFDLERMTYRMGIRLLGITFGKKQPLPGFDMLYLKHNTYNKGLEYYDGYLRLSNGTTLHLLQRKTKEKALPDMQQIAQDLQLELRDLTAVPFQKH